MITREIILSPKAKKTLDKFVRGLMFFACIILFIAAFMLPSLILSSKHSNDLIWWVIILFFMILIIVFGFMCLSLATKFKYELTFNDTERWLTWDKLSLSYKKFWMFQEVFFLILGIFMLIIGFVFVIYKDWLAIIVIMSGLSLLISIRREYIKFRDLKEARIKKIRFERKKNELDN